MLGAIPAGLLCAATWIWLHHHRPITEKGTATRLTVIAHTIVRLLVGTLCLWALFDAFSKLIVLGTTWPLWLWAAIGAVAIELIFWLYSFEGQQIERKLTRRLLGLRLGSLLLILLVLLEPLWAIYGERRVDKTVVVLIDDSASMHLEDNGWSDSETLDIVELFDPRAVTERPGHAARLRRLERILASLDALNTPPGTPPDPGEVQHLVRQLQSSNLLPDAEDELFRDALRHPEDLAILTDKLRAAAATLPREMEAADTAWLERQSTGRQERIRNAAQVTRSDVARRVLVHGERPLLDQLTETYNLEVFGVTTTPRPIPVDAIWDDQIDRAGLDQSDKPGTPPAKIDRGGTDLTTALRHVIRSVPPEELGGVLILSDGRHNGADEVDLPAAQLAGRGLPVHSVLLGTRIGLRDAAVARVEAPETVFAGEEMVVQAELNFSGLRGESATVQLLYNDGLAEQRNVPIADERERHSVSFEHKPDIEGVVEYSIRIVDMEGERFANNNERTFEVAVSDDRTNVLLVDATPRWEFRYLRNLFYGRDAAIHLQYVLLNPDHIVGQVRATPVSASVDREYGEAEATALPENEEDWLKFDAIILGDVAPRTLDRRTVDIIAKAVTKRGALLVVSCGENSMPHAHKSTVFRDLLPIQITDGLRTVAPEPAYQIGLTALGRLHPIMQQSSVPNENERIWANQPPLYWRHPGVRAREGSEVLAYAERVDPITGISLDPPILGTSLDANRARSARERTRPLVVARRAGRGQVVAITTDQSWRLRHKAGDIYHHKFWGQLLQWGAGERLRAGNDQVRLGTDKLVYGQDDPVRIQVKVIDEAMLPNEDSGEAFEVSVYREGESDPVLKHPLTYQENSAGRFEAQLPSFGENGRFRVVLPSKQSAAPVETTFTVAGGQMSLELSELSSDPATLQRLADLTDGQVFGPESELEAIELFGSAREIVPERRDITLWDTWPIFLAFLGLLAAE